MNNALSVKYAPVKETAVVELEAPHQADPDASNEMREYFEFMEVMEYLSDAALDETVASMLPRARAEDLSGPIPMDGLEEDFNRKRYPGLDGFLAGQHYQRRERR